MSELDKMCQKSLKDVRCRTAQLAQQCLDAQGGCNICGLAQSFAQAMKGLVELGLDTNQVASHPVTRGWISKLSSLCSYKIGDGTFTELNAIAAGVTYQNVMAATDDTTGEKSEELFDRLNSEG